jgi:hypothetical protein
MTGVLLTFYDDSLGFRTSSVLGGSVFWNPSAAEVFTESPSNKVRVISLTFKHLSLISG